jgi:flagellar motor switch protein FliM
MTSPDTPEEEEVNQDDMAAAWEAASMNNGDEDDAFDMASVMGMDDEEDSTRILNQDEIDSLLGFDDGSADATISGIHAIVNSSMVSYERLPMLEVVFDRLVRLMSTSLRNFTSDNVEITLDNITSIRFGDYLNSIPLPALLAVVKAEEWDNMALLTVDSALTYSVVDVLLGGRRGGVAMRVEGRPYTTIERNLIERMVTVVLADMSAAFDPLSPVNFHFERLEINPRFATIARPANAAVLVKLRIDMEDRGGRMEFCLPYATLEPVREILLQMFMGEKFGRDSIWENHLASELWLTDVPISAVLGEVVLPLRQIIDWKPGTRIELNTTPDAAMELRCGDIPLFSGHVGQRNNNIALRVDNRLIKTTE